jgi:hypothetical protein
MDNKNWSEHEIFVVIASEDFKRRKSSKCFKKIYWNQIVIRNTCFAYVNPKFFDQNIGQNFGKSENWIPFEFFSTECDSFGSIEFPWIIFLLVFLSVFFYVFWKFILTRQYSDYAMKMHSKIIKGPRDWNFFEPNIKSLGTGASNPSCLCGRGSAFFP